MKLACSREGFIEGKGQVQVLRAWGVGGWKFGSGWGRAGNPRLVVATKDHEILHFSTVFLEVITSLAVNRNLKVQNSFDDQIQKRSHVIVNYSHIEMSMEKEKFFSPHSHYLLGSFKEEINELVSKDRAKLSVCVCAFNDITEG